MKPKAIVRIGIDIGMTVLLLLLMAYELIGSGLHEWIGLAMFVLFVCHHLLNRGWYKNLFRGSYTPMRLLQTILARCSFPEKCSPFCPSAAGEALAGRCTFCAPTGALCCSRCIWASIGGA